MRQGRETAAEGGRSRRRAWKGANRSPPSAGAVSRDLRLSNAKACVARYFFDKVMLTLSANLANSTNGSCGGGLQLLCNNNWGYWLIPPTTDD
eukprot:1588896-Pyramimonas_sp.AAC.2